MEFHYSQDIDKINFRDHPELYQVGKAEQGVLLVEPYKSEILPVWRFRTPDVARQSSEDIYELFLQYKSEQDFVGMDMARKFLQMGFTRARRNAGVQNLAKHPNQSRSVLPGKQDRDKAEAAKIFYEKYIKARSDSMYQKLKEEHEAKYG